MWVWSGLSRMLMECKAFGVFLVPFTRAGRALLHAPGPPDPLLDHFPRYGHSPEPAHSIRVHFPKMLFSPILRDSLAIW
jgi:hypothetical protein